MVSFTFLTLIGFFILIILGPIVFIIFLLPIIYSSLQFKHEKSSSPIWDAQHFLPSKTFGASRNEAEELVVLMHGWPDDISMLYPIAESLANSSSGKSVKRRCVVLSLPNYPLPPDFDGEPGEYPKNRSFGFSFAECVALMRSNVTKECDFTKCKSHVFIGHDWGSILSALYVHKFADSSRDEIKTRLIQVDAGFRSIKWGFAVFFVLYQGILNLIYMLPTSLGDVLTNKFARLLGYKQRPGRCTPVQAMNWPYRAAFREALWGGTIGNFKKFRPKDSKVPRLFVYGEKNPIKLFDDRFLESVKKSAPGVSRVESLPGNHWFFIPNPDPFIDVLESWLVSSRAPLSPSQRAEIPSPGSYEEE